MEDKKLCPFRKETYFMINTMGGPRTTNNPSEAEFTQERFLPCLKEKCIKWNSVVGCTGRYNMLKTKNCPNCGASYEPDLNKCPYCGMIYFDMSIIDFSNNDPFFLKIRKDGLCITQLVRPTTGEFKIIEDTTYVDDGINNTKMAAITNRTAITDLSFEVGLNGKTLIRIDDNSAK